MAEDSKLIISASDRIMHRSISDVDLLEHNMWTLSDPIPGARIINTWEIYHNIMLVLAVTDAGKYCLFRSVDQKKYTLAHEHNARIYGVFYLDDGHMLFSAADGWWATTDTGLTWIDLDQETPVSRALSAIRTGADTWSLSAYGEDHKLYNNIYPACDWIESFDTTTIWTDKWYPALAGSPVCSLAGAGNKLLRSQQAGAVGSWSVIHEVDGIIKSIVASDQSSTPVFLIEIEQADGETSKLFWTYDLGDSLIADLNRVDMVSSVQSVYLTGTNDLQTMFAVLGKRVAGGEAQYKVITDEGSP
jgi:hypothetical protein